MDDLFSVALSRLFRRRQILSRLAGSRISKIIHRRRGGLLVYLRFDPAFRQQNAGRQRRRCPKAVLNCKKSLQWSEKGIQRLRDSMPQGSLGKIADYENLKTNRNSHHNPGYSSARALTVAGFSFCASGEQRQPRFFLRQMNNILKEPDEYTVMLHIRHSSAANTFNTQ